MKLQWLPAFVAIVGTLVLVKSVYADGSVLTEDRIRAFYKEATDVQMKGVKPTMAFMKKHTHEDAKSVIHAISNMAGVPPQKETMRLNKQELLRETQKGMDMGDIESIESNILQLKILENGRSAKVKDSTFSVFNMTMNTPQGTVKFRVEQSMLCDSLIVLSNDNVIQSKDNNCSSEANIKPVQ